LIEGVLLGALLIGAPASPSEPAPVGVWASYKWVRPGLSDTLIRYSIVSGAADGSRRMEIDYQRETNRAFIAYDMLAGGDVEQVVLQMGPGAAPFILPVKPRPPSEAKVLPESLKKRAAGKSKPRVITVATPSGPVRCKVTQSLKGEACLSDDVPPLGLVWLRDGKGSRMEVLGFGSGARSQIVRKPRKLPKHLIEMIHAPALPETP
jgi:hypothetical protein